MADPGWQDSDPRAARFRRWVVSATLILVVVSGLGVAYWRWPTQETATKSFTHQDAPGDDPVAPDPGYVGTQVCAACHSERVAEFEKTTHFKACREPKIGQMPPGFEPGKGVYKSRDPGLRFETTESVGQFTQTAIKMNRAGEKRSVAPIGLLYGNGVGDQIYFTWNEDRLFELPIAWLFPLNCWAEKPFDTRGSGNYLKTTTPRCLECHNTWIEHVAGSENQYRRDNMILGVTCEKCHGPGREHVAYHRENPDAKPARSVVHPGRLSRDRQMDVCGQCHSNAPKRRGPAFSYRPGEPLESFFRTALNRHQEDDHVADQVKYLRQSKCFQMSDTMTCVTCHNPHRPSESAVAETSVGRSCQKCHQPAECRERVRLPLGVRDDCVKCHMPQFSRIQVLFHTPEDQYVPQVRPRQHRVGIYPVATQEVLLKWHRTQAGEQNRQEAARLTQALVQHWLGDAEKFRKEYRFIAAIAALREALRIDPSPASRAILNEVIAIQAKLDADLGEAVHLTEARQFSEAVDVLEKMLVVKPDLAAAHYRLGTLYAVAEQNERAIEHLQAAARSDPDDESADAMLGWLAFQAGKSEEAIEHYRRADAKGPFISKINYHWGLALLKLERWPEAAERFRQVTIIDPNHAGGWQGLSQALRLQNKPHEAVRYAQKSARMTRFENPDVLLTLAEIYVDLSRWDEAEDVAAKAIAGAEKPDSKLSYHLRRRFLEIRGQAKRSGAN